MNKKRDSHTKMERLRNELKMMSVNQLSCYHTAIEMFNIINNNSSASLHEEMIQVPKGYGLRGLVDGTVLVPKKERSLAMDSTTWGQSCGISYQLTSV